MSFKFLEGDTDCIKETLVEEVVAEDEVSVIFGATKAVGKGTIDGRPSISRPVLMV